MLYPAAWSTDVTLEVPGEIHFTAGGLESGDHVFHHRHLLDIVHTVLLTGSLHALRVPGPGSSGQHPGTLLSPAALRIKV